MKSIEIDRSKTLSEEPHTGHNRWHPDIEPLLEVEPGEEVVLQTRDASDGQTLATGGAQRPGGGRVHPLTGPVYVEGASPGDIVAVTLLDIEVGEWGWAAIAPGFGFLADRFTEPYYKAFDIDPGATHARSNDRILVPLAPFPGVMGVAPATDSLLSTIPPRANGGNMDNRHLRPGTTVYFPVFVEGALFSIGDTHAAQGDGEVSGTAIEAPMRIRYRIEVVDLGRDIEEPQYETDEYYAVTAFATTVSTGSASTLWGRSTPP